MKSCFLLEYSDCTCNIANGTVLFLELQCNADNYENGDFDWYANCVLLCISLEWSS